MSAYLTISFEGRRVGLVKEDLSLTELRNFFDIDEAGAHLKVKMGSCFQNVWPDIDGRFSLPADCLSAILVAMRREEVSTAPTFGTRDSGSSTASASTQLRLPFARRGNSAAMSALFTGGGANNSSSFQVMARGRSKLPGLGSRPVPSMFGGKGKKRKSAETKSFRLTYVNVSDNQLEDMWEIPIDLNHLQEMYGMYTLFNVVMEVENQLCEPDAKLVITDIKGNPVRDMSTTRGHSYWNGQKIFRAIYAKNFQDWKPLVWQSIKGDYGIEDDNSETLYSDEFQVQNPIQSSTLEAKVDKILDLLSKEEEKSSIKEVFKCSICLETCSNLMMSCTNSKGCGRLLGCFTCFYYISKCPLCRKDLSLVKERKPLIIPGLATILGVQEISVATAMSQLGDTPTALPDTDEEDEILETAPIASVLGRSTPRALHDSPDTT